MRPAGLPPVGEYTGFVSFASPTMVQPSSSASKPLVGMATAAGAGSGSEPHATTPSPASARPITNAFFMPSPSVSGGANAPLYGGRSPSRPIRDVTHSGGEDRR